LNIFVTGGAGGIGSTLALKLTQNGHRVIAYDNLNNGYENNLKEKGDFFCQFIKGDIRISYEQLANYFDYHNIDVVIHLAAITSLPQCEIDPHECIDVNVGGTANILNAARRKGIHVIVASTSAIYENNDPKEAPFKEDFIVNPKLFYPLSKKLMEETIQSFIRNYDMNITTLRFFNVFGPRQDIYRKSPPLMNYIVRQVKNKQSMTFYSSGNNPRDYIHVDDVVSMIEKVLPRTDKQIFNVCTGTLTTVADIILYAKMAFGSFEYKFDTPTKYWSGYDELYKGVNPILDFVIEHEVKKFSLGCTKKSEQLLEWKPNKNIESLMIESMKENYELYS
jgi:nucleoside-diphosphate-sugar epimerase